jgi:hypothetical protein
MKDKAPLLLISLFALLCFAQPASAAETQGILFGGYWSGFVSHWEKVFAQQDGIAMAIVAVGIVAIFIITRGKWLK